MAKCVITAKPLDQRTAERRADFPVQQRVFHVAKRAQPGQSYAGRTVAPGGRKSGGGVMSQIGPVAVLGREEGSFVVKSLKSCILKSWVAKQFGDFEQRIRDPCIAVRETGEGGRCHAAAQPSDSPCRRLGRRKKMFPTGANDGA